MAMFHFHNRSSPRQEVLYVISTHTSKIWQILNWLCVQTIIALSDTIHTHSSIVQNTTYTELLTELHISVPTTPPWARKHPHWSSTAVIYITHIYICVCVQYGHRCVVSEMPGGPAIQHHIWGVGRGSKDRPHIVDKWSSLWLLPPNSAPYLLVNPTSTNN